MGPRKAAERAAQPSLEAALARLEEIARELEGGGLELEQALERYREARRLYDLCVQKLSAAEREVQVLMADGRLQELDGEDPGAAGGDS
jgi:exodeoxyribonuclease VII small subunit